ncbi:DUF6122 family protein [Ochrovirga pacifica]|uniref:DUF6122 family protein n=1 Tax=Ochrovirga pacifica TaxID=1042376 RepID=UPI0008FBC4F6|nr:DUF6122 family protein [Ochrovirga pacifica]
MPSFSFLIHYGLHFIAPLGIAYLYKSDHWRYNYFVLIATMLVDLDHLFAYPNIFDPNRCSINFHPLHSYPSVFVYFIFLFFKKTRLLGIGLLFHMLTDLLDCLFL